ncbi:MAG: aspartate aminotransferase family protein [Acidilobaceae archaeon]
MASYSLLEERIRDLRREFEAKFIDRTPGSRALFERASRVLPGGVTYAIRYFKPYPIYIERADGSKIWDVDGNTYIDFWMGHGANILGHAPRFIIDTIREASLKGLHLGFENPYAVEYAELLAKIIPSVELLRFTNSGTEANMYAARLARAYTRRRYIVKIEGGWHGGYDSLHTGVTPPFTGPESAGLPEDFIKYTLVVPFNNIEYLEDTLRKYPVAAVFIEPVIGAGGCIEPIEGYLKSVREITERYGSLLVFDEVITGFRLALGGAQEYFNIKPDITVLGKIIGGGYPGAGAFGGIREVMELVDHIKYPDPRSRAFHGGTFVGNLITITAGYTVVKYLSNNKSLYEKAENLWTIAARRIDKICEEHDRLCWVTGVSTMIGVHFTKIKPRSVREAYEQRWSNIVEETLNLYTRVNGIAYVSEKMVHLLPSLIHTREEAEKLIAVIEHFLAGITRK